MRVLIIDDDPAFRELSAVALDAAGYQMESADNASSGLELLQSHPAGHFDAVLLDVQMPGASGWDLLFKIREAGNEVPVLFISGLADVEDRVKGLRLGADDYLTKPVEYEELIARIESVVRRRLALPTIEFGVLSFDPVRRVVKYSGKVVDLSPREYDLLLYLAQAGGEVVSRKSLLEDVWNMPFDPGTNVVNVHINRLRRKLDRCGPPVIETVRGEGYRAVGDPKITKLH
ncbi:MAG: response regulator transcription factor [Planctomycetota bacterium]|nr:response regulator transcription factor [Planctomycetota bacterium]